MNNWLIVKYKTVYNVYVDRKKQSETRQEREKEREVKRGREASMEK